MAKKLRLIVFIVAAIAVVAVIISSGDRSYKEETPPIMADTTGLETEVPVIGLRLQPQTFNEVIRVTGVLAAWNRAMISSEVGGRIVKWSVEIGEHVSRGEAIVQIDDEVAQFQLRQAEAALESATIASDNARRNLERQTKLYSKGDLSSSLLEATELNNKGAVAGLKAAEAAEGLARRAVNETRVKMPFNGQIATKLIDVGQSIPPGTPVAEVVQTNPLRLRVGVVESDIARIKPGQNVILKLSWGDGSEVYGKVHAVGAAAELSTRLFPVEIAVPNRSQQFKPGMSVSAEITVAQFTTALVIPQDALNYTTQTTTCFVVEDGRTQLREVLVGPAYGGNIMLSEGVAEGDVVIVTGMNSVKLGQRVSVKIKDQQ